MSFFLIWLAFIKFSFSLYTVISSAVQYFIKLIAVLPSFFIICRNVGWLFVKVPETVHADDANTATPLSSFRSMSLKSLGIEQISQNIISELNQIQNWLLVNNRHRHIKDPTPNIMNSQDIGVSHFNFLSLTIDEHANWHAHILHDDVTKWKHFPRYWSIVQGIHRSPVIFPHKGQWRRALMFS